MFLDAKRDLRMPAFSRSDVVSYIGEAKRDIHEGIMDAASAESAHLSRRYSPSFNRNVS